jgi:hypothetical protein
MYGLADSKNPINFIVTKWYSLLLWLQGVRLNEEITIQVPINDGITKTTVTNVGRVEKYFCTHGTDGLRFWVKVTFEEKGKYIGSTYFPYKYFLQLHKSQKDN